jgi:hypothetical protein
MLRLTRTRTRRRVVITCSQCPPPLHTARATGLRVAVPEPPSAATGFFRVESSGARAAAARPGLRFRRRESLTVLPPPQAELRPALS